MRRSRARYGHGEQSALRSAARAKFLGNAEPVIGADRARQVADILWKLDGLGDIGELLRACA